MGFTNAVLTGGCTAQPHFHPVRSLWCPGTETIQTRISRHIPQAAHRALRGPLSGSAHGPPGSRPGRGQEHKLRARDQTHGAEPCIVSTGPRFGQDLASAQQLLLSRQHTRGSLDTSPQVAERSLCWQRNDVCTRSEPYAYFHD